MITPAPQLSAAIQRLQKASWLRLALRDHPERGQIEWLYVASLRIQEVQLGFTKDGVWTVNVQGCAVKLLNLGDFVFLLSVLESPKSALELKLKTGFVALGIDPQLIETFPLTELLVSALTSRSIHWASLALEWLEQVAEPAEALKVVVRDLYRNGPTQRIRHQAKRILKRIDEK